MNQVNESEVIAMIKGMQKQITYLEKKIDILINQSGSRPTRPNSFSQRPQSSQSHPSYSERQESRYVPKSTRPVRNFEKRNSDDTQEYSREKKPFYTGAKRGADKPKKRSTAKPSKSKK